MASEEQAFEDAARALPVDVQRQVEAVTGGKYHIVDLVARACSYDNVAARRDAAIDVIRQVAGGMEMVSRMPNGYHKDDCAALAKRLRDFLKQINETEDT